MNLRAQVLQYLNDNGPSTRGQLMDNCGLNSSQLSGILNVMINKDYCIRRGDPRAVTTTFEITDAGRSYFEANKGRHSTTPSRNAQPVLSAPILPNISVTAESLTDQISAVLAENSELRNALTDIRSRINQLLGEEPIYFGEGTKDGEKHSGGD